MRLLLSLLLLLFFVQSADAQTELGVQKQKGFHDLFKITKEEELETFLGIETEEDNKEISKRLSQRFFTSCMQHDKDSAVDKKIKEFLCLCSSTRMPEQMSTEEIQAMFTQTPEGQFQRERMLGLIVTACMEKPARYMSYEKCFYDPLIGKKFKRKADEICGCMADRMSTHVTKQGSALDFSRNYSIDELLVRFLTNAAYNSKYRTSREPCVWKHQYGW